MTLLRSFFAPAAMLTEVQSVDAVKLTTLQANPDQVVSLQNPRRKWFGITARTYQLSIFDSGGIP